MLPPRRLTIWEHIVQQVPGAERDEIREIIGSRHIDKCEGLRDELDALREILVEFQQQNREFRDKLRNRPALPEHPARVLLEQQILMLLNSVRKSGSNIAQVALQPKTCAEKEVFNYVLKREEKRSQGGADGLARPMTSCGTSRSEIYASRARPGTASSTTSRASFSSAPVDIFDPLNRGDLSVFAIDKITKDIRAALEEEAEELLQDIEHVQSLLEMEHEDITQEKNEAMKPPPALEDMREYSAKLEKTWLLEDLESSAGVPSFLAEKRKEKETELHKKHYEDNQNTKHSQDSPRHHQTRTPRSRQSHAKDSPVRSLPIKAFCESPSSSPSRSNSRIVQRLHFAVNSGRQASSSSHTS